MRRRRWACALNEARRVESSQATCTANTIGNDARGPSIGPSVAEILAAREQGIVLLNPETGHAHKNPLLAAAVVADRDLLRFASHFGLKPVAEVSLGSR